MLSAFFAGVVAAAAAATPAPAQASAWETIGHSEQGRPIRAMRVGSPRARVKVMVVGTVHGNEQAGRAVVARLRRAHPPRGTALWLVDDANPDGTAANDRHNARGVDLNRNFPYRWQPQDGVYESGSGPASEAGDARHAELHRARAPAREPLVPPGTADRREEHGRSEARAPLLGSQRPAAQEPPALPRHRDLLAEPHLRRRQRLRRRAPRRRAARRRRHQARQGRARAGQGDRPASRGGEADPLHGRAEGRHGGLRPAPLRDRRLPAPQPEGHRRALHRHLGVRARVRLLLAQRARPRAARAARASAPTT